MTDPHDHHHDHGHESAEEMTDMDKLSHLLKHWQEHNRDHEANYRNWARKASEAGKADAAALLDQAAEATNAVTDLFKKALVSLA
jgi:hypothetical protein